MAIYRGVAEKLVDIYDFDWEDNLRMKETCICSVESVIANVIDIAIVVLFAALTGVMKEFAVYFLTFGTLRFYAGGAHAKNYLRCIISYICIMCVCFMAVHYLIELPDICTYCVCVMSIVISGWINGKYAARQRTVGSRSTMYRKHALTIHKIISGFMIIICIAYPHMSSAFWQEIVLIQAFALTAQSVALFMDRKECVNESKGGMPLSKLS